MDRLTRRPAARTEPRGGFTIVELMVATVILAIGLMAMLALQLHAVRGSQGGRHYTQAAQVARDMMEQLERLPWADAQVQPTPGWVVQPAQSTSVLMADGTTTTEQTFNLDYRVQADPANPKLRAIDVRVTWYEPQDPPPPATPRRRYAITSVRFDDGK